MESYEDKPEAESQIIPFPKSPGVPGRTIKTMSLRAVEAFLLDSVSAGSAVFVGTVERRGRRYQCYRVFNSSSDGTESTMVYQALH